MRNFRNWDVYKNSRKLTIKIYKATDDFPDTERFGLISQIRRSSVSIVANIGEGAGRSTDKDFKHSLDMAIGSSFELEALLELSQDLNCHNDEEILAIKEELNIVQKQLNAFISKIKSDAKSQ